MLISRGSQNKTYRHPNMTLCVHWCPISTNILWLWRIMIIYSKSPVNFVIVLWYLKVVVDNCSTLYFSVLDCVLLDSIMNSSIQNISIFNGTPEQKYNACVKIFLRKVMVIICFKCFHIFEATTLRFWVHQSHWIRSNLIAQKLLNPNLPETIQVLLPTQTKPILLVNSWTTVAI